MTARGYALQSPEGDALGEAAMGAPLSFEWQGQRGELLVAEAVGLPGAQFLVSARSQLSVTERLQKELRIKEEGKQSGVLRVALEGDNPNALPPSSTKWAACTCARTWSANRPRRKNPSPF